MTGSSEFFSPEPIEVHEIEGVDLDAWLSEIGNRLWFPTLGQPFEISGGGKAFLTIPAFNRHLPKDLDPSFRPEGFTHKGDLMMAPVPSSGCAVLYHFETPFGHEGLEGNYRSVFTRFVVGSAGASYPVHSCFIDQGDISIEDACSVNICTAKMLTRYNEALRRTIEDLETSFETGTLTGYKASKLLAMFEHAWPNFTAALKSKARGNDLHFAFLRDYYHREAIASDAKAGELVEGRAWNAIVDLLLISNWFSSGVYKMKNEELESFVQDRLGIRINARAASKRLERKNLTILRSSGPAAKS